jgi:hypothetical protein
MFKFEVVEKWSPLFEVTDTICQESYKKCDILAENETFGDEYPDRYFVVRENNIIRCTTGIFESESLPAEELMKFKKRRRSVEFGRFCFNLSCGNKHERWIKMLEISRFVIFEIFYFLREQTYTTDFLLDTRHELVSLLRAATRNRDFLIPIQFELIPENFRPERKGHTDALLEGRAGLYRINPPALLKEKSPYCKSARATEFHPRQMPIAAMNLN